jgi:3-methyladenine DNA glycosylase Mpg
MSTPFEKDALEALMRGYAHGFSHGSARFNNDEEDNNTMGIENKVSQDFFARPSIDVANELLGYELVRRKGRGELRGKITEVAAWEGEDGKNHPGLRYAPGTIAISKVFGKHILLLSTRAENIPACVTITGIELQGAQPRALDGPGNVTEALEIDTSLDKTPVYNSDSIAICRVPRQGEVMKRDKKNVPANCKGYFYLKR